MANMSLGGGGRFAAYAAKFGKQAAIDHCHAKYGEEACNAMHHEGTKAAPYARASAKNKKKKGKKGNFPSFKEFVAGQS